MAWIDPQRVRDRWIDGDFPVDDVVVSGLIADAEVVIRDDFPDIDARLAADSTGRLRNNVDFVVTRMVLRVLRNPDGVRSRTSQTGPLSDTVTMGGDDPGSPFLDDQERKMLSPRGAGNQAFSIDPSAGNPRHLTLGGGARW